MSRILK